MATTVGGVRIRALRLAATLALAAATVVVLSSCFPANLLVHPWTPGAQDGASTSAPGGKPALRNAISFTRIDGVPYARLCAPVDVEMETLSESLIDTDPSKGWVDLELSTLSFGRQYAMGTQWDVGKPLPGLKFANGAGQKLDFSKSYWKLDITYADGASDRDVVGRFNALTLVDGTWVDSKGNPESSACADYHPAG